MDPATGTFTSMDTYGGSLSDPTSLHKYLFANSNPVKYCDPSGHSSIAETSVVVTSITILTAASTGVVYSILGDIYGSDKTQLWYWLGMIGAVTLAAVLTYFVAGAFVAGVSLTILGKIMLGILGVITGKVCFDISNVAYTNGYLLYGLLFGIAGLVLQYYGLLELWLGVCDGIDRLKSQLSSNSDVNSNNTTNDVTNVTNPNGRKGGPAHQGKISDIKNTPTEGSYDTELYIATPGGYKNSRYADVAEYDVNGDINALYQVGKVTQSGIPVSRERKAIMDIMASDWYVNNGKPNIYFVPYNSDIDPILYN